MSNTIQNDSERIQENVQRVLDGVAKGKINPIYYLGRLLEDNLVTLDFQGNRQEDRLGAMQDLVSKFILQARRMMLEREGCLDAHEAVLVRIENNKALETSYQKVRPRFVTSTGAPVVIAALH